MSGGIEHTLNLAAELVERAAQEIANAPTIIEPGTLEVVRAEFAASSIRQESLPKAMRPEIAWRIMMELYLAHREHRKSYVKHVCLSSGAPDTTVLRYLETLIGDGWVSRHRSKDDRRVVELEATQPAIEVIEAWAKTRIHAFKTMIQREPRAEQR